MAVDEVELAEAGVVVVVVDVDAPPRRPREGSRPGARPSRSRARRASPWPAEAPATTPPAGRNSSASGSATPASTYRAASTPRLREEVEHAGGRADRVAVGALVDGEGRPRGAAHGGADGVELVRGDRHAPSAASSCSASSPASRSPALSGVGSPAPPARLAFVVGRKLAFVAFEQGLDAHAAVDRLVVEELELRRALDAHVGGHALLQAAVRGAQAGERVLALARPAQHADEDLGVAQVGRRLDAGHRDEPDARVLEGGDLLREHLAQGLVDLQEPVSHSASTGSTDFTSTRETSKSRPCRYRSISSIRSLA